MQNTASTAHTRYDRLDALRGLAMVWMTVFHFCFDLHQFKWINQDFYRDPFWTWQRVCIVTLFLLCAGAGQAVALHQGQSWPRFWRRWALVALCALLVTASSYVMFPKSFIYFGVLHGIAVMLIIVRLTAHWGAWLWPLGAVVIAMKFIAINVINTWTTLGFLNQKAFNWLGFISVKPVTEDYVPLIPWLGVMWWGVAGAQWLLQHRPALLTGNVPPAARWLVWMGGYSLVYYMLHQPVMMGLLWVVQQFR
jgi:uncharacterized membrane protein